MEEFRSRSFGGDGRMEMGAYGSRHPPPRSAYDFRCYSSSYASSEGARGQEAPKEFKIHKGQRTSGSSSSSSSSSSSRGGWNLSDPELQRKKRVASYKAYAMEGKMKGSLRKRFRWLKERCNQVVYGWR